MQSLYPLQCVHPAVQVGQTGTHLLARGQGLDELLHCPRAVRVERRTDQPVLLRGSLEHLHSGQRQTVSDTLWVAGCNCDCVCHHSKLLHLRSKPGSHPGGHQVSVLLCGFLSKL